MFGGPGRPVNDAGLLLFRKPGELLEIGPRGVALGGSFYFVVGAAEPLQIFEQMQVSAHDVIDVGGGVVAAEFSVAVLATISAPTQHGGTQARPVNGQSSFARGSLPGLSAVIPPPGGQGRPAL